MSVMDNIMNLMKLSSDDDSEYYDSEDDGYYDGPNIEPIRKSAVPAKDDYSYESENKFGKVTPKVVPAKKKSMSPSDMEVCVIKPTSVEEAREITETLLANRTVVLNLEGLDVDVAQRIIDFTSGSCFAISGNLQKISRYIFIVTPKSVDISGDFQEMLSGAYEDSMVHDGPQAIN